MKQKVRVIPSTPSHYEDILKIFNEGFFLKLRYVTRKIDQQLSFARDFGLFNIESVGQEFVAVVNGRVLGFISLQSPGRVKPKNPGILTIRELVRQYGLISIFKALLLAVAFYHKPKEGELYIDTVGVFVNARSQGIGTLLLDFAEVFARENGLSTLTLSVIYENPKAKALYERLGFQVKSSHSLWWLRKSTGISGAYFMTRKI